MELICYADWAHAVSICTWSEKASNLPTKGESFWPCTIYSPFTEQADSKLRLNSEVPFFFFLNYLTSTAHLHKSYQF